MKDMTLVRVADTGLATFGCLLKDAGGYPFALTLERPWRANRPSIGDLPGSCIPPGEYRCMRCRASPDYNFRDSPRFGDTFQVFNVPGRSQILFHKGNLEDDTRGCILVGESFNYVAGRPGITASAQGFAEFLAYLAGESEFRLRIVAPPRPERLGRAPLAHQVYRP